MNIFFWFFKQLFYILKRFTKHKLTLLFVFFVIAIILFLKPSFATDLITIQSNVYGNSNSYNIPSFSTLPTTAANLINSGKPYIIRRWAGSNPAVYELYIINSNNGYFYHKSNESASIVHNINTIYGCNYYEGATPQWKASNGIASSVELNNVIYYGGVIYGNINKNTIYFNPFINPFIVNTSNIPTWDFTRLLINMGDLTLELPEGVLGDYTYYLNYNYNEQDVFTIPINEYYVADNTTLPQTRYFSVPNNVITNNIVIRPSYTIRFSITRYDRSNNSSYYDLGTYTLTITQEQADIINQNNQQQQLSDINKEQQNTTNAINDLNNSITDSSVSDDSIFLPTLEVNDPTQVGINNIFDLLYNAFTTGDAEDIVLPFPFTNKTITIPGNLTYNVLHNNGGDILITIIRAFWWYKIASFIAYDVFSKLKTIQEGNIEDVQKENIKGDML